MESSTWHSNCENFKSHALYNNWDEMSGMRWTQSRFSNMQATRCLKFRIEFKKWYNDNSSASNSKISEIWKWIYQNINEKYPDLQNRNLQIKNMKYRISKIGNQKNPNRNYPISQIPKMRNLDSSDLISRISDYPIYEDTLGAKMRIWYF